MREVINNMVLTVNSKDMETIKKKLESNDRVLVVELDGINIHSWKDYILEIQSKFSFPTPCFDSVDRYLDWMRDLGWLDMEEFALIINHFSAFVKNDPELKSKIVSDFIDVIIPFWQDEVKEVVVEGKAKPFMVYLVD